MTTHSSLLTPPYLAVALDGVGWHPPPWREADVDPRGTSWDAGTGSDSLERQMGQSRLRHH